MKLSRLSEGMQLRSRAMAGYSINAECNIEIMEKETYDFEQDSFCLLQVWCWIDRIECLKNSESLNGPYHYDGVIDLIDGNFSENAKPHSHRILRNIAFTSKRRNEIRQTYGWGKVSFVDTKKSDGSQLELIIEDYKIGLERAAALFLWHGEIDICVSNLQKIISLSSDSSYKEIISMIIVSITGYPSSSASSAASTAWLSLSNLVLSRLDTLDGIDAAYLKGIMFFLIEGLSEKHDYHSIMNDRNIGLDDRICFAFTYLSNSSVNEFIEKNVTDAVQFGFIEGVLLTGFKEKGHLILQNYLDRTSDIQSCALLAALYSKSPSKLDSKEAQWIQIYRTLLNKYELFVKRAQFDVQLANRERLLTRSKGNTPESRDISLTSSFDHSPDKRRGGLAPSAASTSLSSREKAKSSNLPWGLYTNPVPLSKKPHLLIRCHFCNTSLPSDNPPQPQNSSSRKQRPLLNCCPGCKRQLPLCYVCHMYIGLINPNLEFTRNISVIKSQTAKNSNSNNLNGNSNNSSSGNNEQQHVHHDNFVLDKGQWIFFCQRCKHGGHASCIDCWFSKKNNVDLDTSSDNLYSHSVCGVNGCNCFCVYN